MMAYARMQFDDVTQEERDAVFNALLSYCELDTLAMVMTVRIKGRSNPGSSGSQPILQLSIYCH